MEDTATLTATDTNHIVMTARKKAQHEPMGQLMVRDKAIVASRAILRQQFRPCYMTPQLVVVQQTNIAVNLACA